ncbi:MAG TPA: mechanosensitive ion channel family protein [Candidatus Bathyarchaeia archaeon]|jgi:small conductance mechanosensitive channel|nr:mechanosensitive ion channel family protein [Candidatus Bathyarchaeia archaeon]
MDINKPPLSTIVDVLRTNGVRIVVILVVALIAVRISTLLVHGIVKALLDREATEGTAQELSAVEVQKRMDTLDDLGGRVIRFFVIVIAGIMILSALDLDIGPAIAGLGVVGIAVGFGAQSLVRDYLNGALILAENQYSKGDVVSIAGVSGAVEDFSLRRTTLRDLDGTVHTVPNGEIKVASNRTRTWARINQNVTVAFGTDIDKAIQVVEELGKSMAADPVWKRRILEPPRVERVESIDERGITLKILGTVRASEQWAAGGEFRKLLLETFTKNGIDLPRPQQVFVTNSDGNATAAASAQSPGPAPSQDDLADE